MLLQTCGCGCSEGAVSPSPATNDKCRNALANTSIAELVWLQGLDVNLCERFQRLVDVVGLRDCAGNRISLETPVVLCSDFQTQLCDAIAGLASGGIAIPESTQLLGADCLLYTIPTPGAPGTEIPNSVTDTSSINFSATGTLSRNISGAVKVSADAGNVLTIHVDGLFVPTPPTAIPVCTQLQAFPLGGDVEAGTVLIGADCLAHIFPGIPAPGFTVSDTSSIELVLIATNLQANLILDPSSIGRITGSGLQITCADILTCAPPVTVSDSQSVNLSLFGQALVADVIIDPDAVNALELRPAGLFVDVCTALNSGAPPVPATVAVTALVGADCNRYTIPPQVPVTALDTATADITISGGTQVRVDVKIEPGTLLSIGASGLQVTCEAVQDCVFGTTNNFWTYNDLGNSVSFNPSADAGNQIVTGADGRPYVAEFALSVLDTNCINLQLAAGVLSAVPIISAQPDNAILCLPDGLFASALDVSVTGDATNCFTVGVSELTANQFVVSVTPIISPVAGNVLQCTVQGLYAAGSVVAVQDTDCINLTLTEAPAGTFTLSAVPTIADAYPGFASGCNSLQCTPTGLATPPEHTCGVEVAGIGLSSTTPMIATDTFVSTSILIFTNNDPCRDVQLTLNYIWPTMSAGTQTTPMTLRDNMVITSSNPGIVPNRNVSDDLSVETPTIGFDMTRGRASLIEHGGVLAPGASITIQVQHTYTMLRGDAGVISLDGAEVSLNWQTV